MLSICERCEQSKSSTGESLLEAVKDLRRARELKEVFKVEAVRCLKCCDSPCAVELSGKKRSTYTRVHLGVDDVAVLVDAAVRYAALAPGEELPERILPGEPD